MHDDNFTPAARLDGLVFRVAWPAHKEQCKASASGRTGAGTGSTEGSPQTLPSDAPPRDSPSAPAAAGAGGASSRSMQAALEDVLAESAAGNANRLESLFETSVLSFLRGDYRGATTQVSRNEPFDTQEHEWRPSSAVSAELTKVLQDYDNDRLELILQPNQYNVSRRS